MTKEPLHKVDGSREISVPVCRSLNRRKIETHLTHTTKRVTVVAVRPAHHRPENRDISYLAISVNEE